MNSKLEKIVTKVAKQRGEDPALVMEIIDSLFKVTNDVMSDYRYPEVRINGLGVFRPRVTMVEEEIAILLLKIKNANNPDVISDKLKTLNLTAQRIRYETRKRKRLNKVAGGTQ